MRRHRIRCGPRTENDPAGDARARIEKIGKDDPQQALAAVTPYISGNSAWIKVQSPGYLRIPALLNRLGITPSATETELTVRLPSGQYRRVTLPLASEPDPATEQENWRALMPVPASQKGRWAGVLDSVKSIPLTYQAPVDVSTHWLGQGHQLLYIRSNQIEGLDGSDLGLKLEMVLLQEVAAYRPKSVIVDLRYNWGGNFGNTIAFSQALPKLVDQTILISVVTAAAAPTTNPRSTPPATYPTMTAQPGSGVTRISSRYLKKRAPRNPAAV